MSDDAKFEVKGPRQGTWHIVNKFDGHSVTFEWSKDKAQAKADKWNESYRQAKERVKELRTK